MHSSNSSVSSTSTANSPTSVMSMTEAASLFAFPPATTDQQHIQAKQEIKDNTHVKTEPIDNITIPTAADDVASIPIATTATTGVAAPTSPSPSTTSTPASSSSSASVSPRSRSRPSHAIMSRMSRPAHGGHTSRITLLRRQRNHVLLATITVARLAKMKADLRVRQLARRAQHPHPPSPAPPNTTTMPASKFTRPYPSSSNTFAPHLFTPFGKLRASALSAPITPFTTTTTPFPISSTFPSNLPLSRSFSLPQRRSPTLGSATSYRMPSPTSLLTHVHTRTPPSSSPLLRSLPSTQPSIFAHTSTLLHGRSSLSYLPPRTSLSPSTPSPSKPAYLGGSFRVNTTPSPPSTSTSTSPATSPSLSPSDRRPSAAILGGSHIYNITSASSSTTAAPSTSSTTFAVPQMVTRRTAKAVTESKVNGVEAEAPTTVTATSITAAASRRRPNKVSILHHPMHGNRISAKQTKILQELPITTSAVAPRKWDPAESALRASIPMTRGRAHLTRHTRSPHLPPSHPATTINSNLHLLSSQVV